MLTQFDEAQSPFSAAVFLESLKLGHGGQEAFHRLTATIESLIDRTRPRTVLELGAGRSPLFRDTERSFRLIANDVSQAELDLLPAGIEQARFDISSPHQIPEQLRGSVDLVFSRSVFEHVRSVDDAMRSTHALLRSNGVALHFFPTLYASPFLLNKVVPFSLSERILSGLLQPEYKRFPARYAQATSTQRALERWRGFGFREVAVSRFYGHRYYAKVPVIRDIETALTSLAQSRGWDWYSSFAYVLLVK